MSQIVLRYAMIFMFLVNTVCSIKNVNELLEEQLNMLISRVLIFRVSFLILLSLLLFVAFFAGGGGGGGLGGESYFDVLQKNFILHFL